MTGGPQNAHDWAPRLCVHLVNFAPGTRDWSALFELARLADTVGIDKIAVSDHVVFGADLTDYARPEVGGRRDGRQPTGPDGHWLEPLTLLAAVAGTTRRVRLATNILLAALRRPVVLAKSVATLDVISGGRVDLGVGVGWQRAEYDAAGLDFRNRGSLLDGTLATIQTLWRDPIATLDVDDRSVEGLHQFPKPLQSGGVPIWISGTVGRHSAARLARFGAGWIPWGRDADDLVESIPRMRQAVLAAGGPERFRVVAGLRSVHARDGRLDPSATIAAAGALIEAGATDLFVRSPRADEHPETYLGSLVEAFDWAHRAGSNGGIAEAT